MSEEHLIFEKDYYGFEDTVDIDRDVSEALDEKFNPIWEKFGGEFQAIIKVTITYRKDKE